MQISKPLRLLAGAFLLSAAPLSIANTVAYAQAATQAAPADAQSELIVDAASAFLATLTSEQKDAVQFDFNDSEQRARWSNFPLGIFERAGVRWGDLSDESRAALTALPGTVLSPYGLTMVEQQMAADDVLASEESGGAATGSSAAPATSAPAGTATAPGGGGGPGGGLTFGSGYYYVALLGDPSTTKPWMLQFGGHHLALNATVVGGDVTLTPSLTGGQPVKFTWNGQAVYIVQDEVTQADALMANLTDEQKASVILGASKIDLVLGPGKDGMTLQPEGLPGSKMTDAQKAQFFALIKSRLMILNDDDLAPKLAAIKAYLDETYFAWYGAVNDAQGSYWRVTGPTVLLEFSPQNIGGDPTNHLHNMYRDPTNDYGVAWTSLS